MLFYCLAIAKLRCTTSEPSCAVRADTFHKPGFKMHVKILHHLFGVVGGDVIKAPLWDVAALGPAAYPSNAVFVHHHVTQLLTTSFPNMRAQQVEVRRPSSAPCFSSCKFLLRVLGPGCLSRVLAVSMHRC